MNLPLNCSTEFYKDYLSLEVADNLFHRLSSINPLVSPAITFGAGIKKEMNYGKLMFIEQDEFDRGRFPLERYGNVALWPEWMSSLRAQLEQFTSKTFGTCVCIYYPDGKSGVAFHSDLRAFGDTSTIPSISLGEEREFCFREKATEEIYSLSLPHGSLVVMGEHCQDRYEHSLPVNPVYKNPRINLTFRNVEQ